MNNSPEEMDAWLESQLEILRISSYERQPATVENARSKFLREAEKARQAFYQEIDSTKQQKTPVVKLWSGLGNRLFPSFARAALAFVIALVVVIGGAAGAVFASQSSLPGDVMYPVKLWGDEIRINLTTDPTEQMQTNLEIAGDRLQEMQQAQDHNQLTEKDTPVSEQAFTGIFKHLDESLLLAQQLYADDPEMLAQITLQIEQQLVLLEEFNPSDIIKELQELRKDLRDQLKELKKAEPEPTSQNTSVPQPTSAPTAAVKPTQAVTTEEDSSEKEEKGNEKEKDKDKETGKDKEKENNSNANSNANNNASDNNSNNSSSNSSSNNSDNSNKGGKKK